MFVIFLERETLTWETKFRSSIVLFSIFETNTKLKWLLAIPWKKNTFEKANLNIIKNQADLEKKEVWPSKKITHTHSTVIADSSKELLDLRLQRAHRVTRTSLHFMFRLTSLWKHELLQIWHSSVWTQDAPLRHNELFLYWPSSFL